jgi:RNA polymerase sigma-70 factor (sigma-E family)
MGVAGEPMRTVVDSQAVAGEAVVDSPDTAPGREPAPVGFLGAPLDDSFVDPVADSGPEEATGSADAIDGSDGPGGTAVLDGTGVLDGTRDRDGVAVLDSPVALNGTALNGAAVLDSASVLNSASVLDDASVLRGPDVLDEAAVLEDDALLEGDAVSDDAAAPADTDVAPGSGNDSGNLGAHGEPADSVARPTDVTETLAASALLPEVVLAPEAFTSQARPASAAWDASEVVTQIYTGHYSQLVRLAVLLVHDVQTAEEVVQDAFEAMHLAWRRLRDSEKALSYLRQTVVNRSRSVLRHRKVVDMHAPKPAPDEPSAEHAALALIERSAVATALRSLPVRQREAVVLRYYADFSEADIAQAMGISRGAVKSHTARAMAALKSILEQETS